MLAKRLVGTGEHTHPILTLGIECHQFDDISLHSGFNTKTIVSGIQPGYTMHDYGAAERGGLENRCAFTGTRGSRAC